MKLGFVTAAFSDLALEPLADWASESGFGALEIACWPDLGPSRRYGGVTHIDVEGLDKQGAKKIRDLLNARNLDISSLAYYPNPLDPESGPASLAHLKKVIDAAAQLEVEIVGTFIGADQTKNADDNFEAFAQVWPPIIRYAAERGIKIAIENCPMLWKQTWPGGQNIGYSPAHWQRMFETIPDDNFGLNIDPSHLIWQFIDEVRPIYEFRDRIFHVHAKDMQIDREQLDRYGVIDVGVNWAVPRLPGLGEVRWNAWFAALYAIGYDWVVSIEHEDRAFEKTEDLVKRGFYLTRDFLKPFIV
jgi:sugar phosphate isomerase/epimerase